METSERLPAPVSKGHGLPRTIRLAYLNSLWSLSGWAVAHYYAGLLRQHGHSPHALAERADDKDRAFYQHLLDGIDLSQPLSVLDIGCGMGDLIDFLQERGAPIQAYLGIDLLKQFVDICRQEYLPPCRFERANFASRSFVSREQYDLVACMGVLVSRTLAYEQYVEHTVDKMLAASRRHVVFNVISEIDRSFGNYRDAGRVGRITCLPRPRLAEIVARAAGRVGACYVIREVRIYPDAVDAFVRITRL